jgi:hypothetical protein
LRDRLNKLLSLLPAAEKALIPQLADIENMAKTGLTWAPKMVDIYSPTSTRSSDGYIKIRKERDCTADLFVPANTDFKNNSEMRNRIGSRIQVQWEVHNLPDGSHLIIPQLEQVAMPAMVWHTVVRVSAIIQPHAGRQSNIKAILDGLQGQGCTDVYWLEKGMKEFFLGNPGQDPIKPLTDKMRLSEGNMDRTVQTLELPSQQGTAQLHVEEVTAEDPSFLALEWQAEHRSSGILHEVEEAG